MKMTTTLVVLVLAVSNLGCSKGTEKPAPVQTPSNAVSPEKRRELNDFIGQRRTERLAVFQRIKAAFDAKGIKYEDLTNPTDRRFLFQEGFEEAGCLIVSLVELNADYLPPKGFGKPWGESQVFVGDLYAQEPPNPDAIADIVIEDLARIMKK